MVPWGTPLLTDNSEERSPVALSVTHADLLVRKLLINFLRLLLTLSSLSLESRMVGFIISNAFEKSTNTVCIHVLVLASRCFVQFDRASTRASTQPTPSVYAYWFRVSLSPVTDFNFWTTKCSATFPQCHNKAIGRKSLHTDGLLVLGSGAISACFQSDGNDEVDNMQLIMFVSGGAISSQNSFDIHDGKSSEWFAFDVLMRRSWHFTSPMLTVDRGVSIAEHCGGAI